MLLVDPLAEAHRDALGGAHMDSNVATRSWRRCDAVSIVRLASLHGYVWSAFMFGISWCFKDAELPDQQGNAKISKTVLGLRWIGIVGHESPKPSKFLTNVTYLRALYVKMDTNEYGGERLRNRWWDELEGRWKCCGNHLMSVSQQYQFVFGKKVAELYRVNRHIVPAVVPSVREVGKFIASQDWSRGWLDVIDKFLLKR